MSRRRITYVIAYDITDPRRLAKAHRFLREYAFPLQYSVFLATLDAAALQTILTGLAAIIHPREDDVRAYPLPDTPRMEFLGAPHLLEDLIANLHRPLTLARYSD